MQDRHRIDSHKLIFHPDRVSDWYQQRLVSPIYLEITPSGGCNHRCVFCALDYMGYEPVFLDADVLKKTVTQACRAGVKSIMYAGEGEPLLHPRMAEIVAHTKTTGVDVALTTNGVLLTPRLSQDILKYFSWIRVSLNAGTARTYSSVHRTQESDFGRVLDNLEAAAAWKKSRRLPVTIGVQLLLIPQNIGEVVRLARRLRQIGVDYLAVKPYSQHPLSGSRIDKNFHYENLARLEKALSRQRSKDFDVVFRAETMARLGGNRDYAHCLGAPFWAYISARGDVYACSAFLGIKKYCYGNIYRQGFREILGSQKRRRLLKFMAERLNASACRQVCRLDKINSYLWELTHPDAHVNFI